MGFGFVVFKSGWVGVVNAGVQVSMEARSIGYFMCGISPFSYHEGPGD